MQNQLVVNGTRNEKDWFILLKKEKTFQISGIKTNNLINQNATNWSLKGAMKYFLRNYKEQKLRPFFWWHNSIDWNLILFIKDSSHFLMKRGTQIFSLNTYHMGRVILFSIKLNCHIGTSIYFIVQCSWSKSRWSVLNHFLSLWCSIRYFWERFDFWRNRLYAMRGRWSSPTIFTGGSSPLS